MIQNNTDSCTVRGMIGLLQDTHDGWYGMLSPIQQLTEQTFTKAKKKPTCHGNIKLQRFKRKCRKREPTEDQINELIQRRNTPHSRQHNDSLVTLNENNPNRSIKIVKTSKTSEKRKRSNVSNRNGLDVMKSLSQISISQPSKKKRKDEDKSTVHDDQK